MKKKRAKETLFPDGPDSCPCKLLIRGGLPLQFFGIDLSQNAALIATQNLATTSWRPFAMPPRQTAKEMLAALYSSDAQHEKQP